MPILFLAGEKDEVIPAPHMQQLYSTSLKGGGPRGNTIKRGSKGSVEIMASWDAQRYMSSARLFRKDWPICQRTCVFDA